MSKKYNVSITTGSHTFQVEGCDSFDEALRVVNKGIHDFELANRPKSPEAPVGPANDQIQNSASRAQGVNK